MPFFSLLFLLVLLRQMKDFGLNSLSCIAQTAKQFKISKLKSNQLLLELNLLHFLIQAQNIGQSFFSFHLQKCFLLFN